MIKFCNFNGELMACDDNTIKKFKLEVIKEVTDEEFAEHNNMYYVKNNEIILGPNPINLIKEEVFKLKQQLAETDYKAIKHSEGLISDEEYEPIKIQRQQWRDKINELENLI